MSLTMVSSDSAWRLDRREAVGLVRREIGLERERRHADDAVHRRPDLVAHVGQELALRAVGRFSGLFGLRQFLLRALPIRAVAGDGQESHRPALRVALERDGLLNEYGPTVLREDLVLEGLDRLFRLVDLRVHLAELSGPLRPCARLEVRAEDLVFLETVQAAEGVVHEQIIAAQIDHAAAVLDLIEDGPVALALAERRFRPCVRRDRAHQRRDEQRAVALLDGDVEFRPEFVTVAVKRRDFLRLDPAFRRVEEDL